ncbi:MAG: ABC transporter permease subunit [Actinobacteria bacterium]|nr:ABC transporter permease subunit [Actinomycetota bacterium]
MMWLTWRQFRAQAITGAAALAALAIALAVTGPHLAHLYAGSGLAACRAHGNCGPLVAAFMDQVKTGTPDELIFILCIGLLLAAPALIGVFWGAPLVTREIEAGTFRLAWNQSVTRARWLAVKLGLIGLASMATVALLSLMVTWWASPLDRASALPDRNGTPAFNRFAPLLFASRGIAPIAYALFAFVLGVAVGVLIRRTVPAMAVTLAVFAALQIAMPLWVRPHLVPPVHASTAFNPAAIVSMTGGEGGQLKVTSAVHLPDAWVLGNQTVTAAGHEFRGPGPAACLSDKLSFSECQAALGRLGLRQLVTYQPASRYWAFQGYEAAIFVVLAVALGGWCAWRIRRGAW